MPAAQQSHLDCVADGVSLEPIIFARHLKKRTSSRHIFRIENWNGRSKTTDRCGCEHSFAGSIPAIQQDGDTFVRVADMYTMFASHIYLDIEQSFESLDTYESLDKYGFNLTWWDKISIFSTLL
jgi:hypothetical protein